MKNLKLENYCLLEINLDEQKKISGGGDTYNSFMQGAADAAADKQVATGVNVNCGDDAAYLAGYYTTMLLRAFSF
jgi:hypothetical protein